jgi:molybdate transport system substrate-binding protein
LPAGSLTVFAAASLTRVFTQIAGAFERANPGVTVELNFAGSQILRTQIEEGAAADVFASANLFEMESLVASGQVEPSGWTDFAANRLVVVVSPYAAVPLGSLADLAKPGVKIVLAAEEVPVGRYARQALVNLNGTFGPSFSGEVLGNVVSLEENVRQVLTKVSLGEADAGIVYATDAVTDPTLKTLAIPDLANVVATYPIAVLGGADRPDLARAFVDFVVSEPGSALLGSAGFLPAGGR